uniref:BMA-ACBP-6, isoform c n=1 Tax=Brugia malayi TaxID=6279 RepID=A0A1I9G091_BRUMA|nr:BMA-ACBP-6, isoform c [Brugia malayi]
MQIAQFLNSNDLTFLDISNYNFIAQSTFKYQMTAIFLDLFIIYIIPFFVMPLSELRKKYSGMNFNIAAEEMRRLDGEPNDEEKLQLYGLYKQIIHGDIPSAEDYRTNIRTYASIKISKPSGTDQWNLRKYSAWVKNKGKDRQKCEKEYVQLAEEMIKKYGRKIVRYY